MSNENLISIYKLDTDSIFFNDCNNDHELMIEKIILRGNNKNELKRQNRDDIEVKDYQLMPLRDMETNGFDLKLYHSARTTSNSWNDFLSSILKENEDKFLNQNHDFIVFVYSGEYIFCFTGGIACHLIKDVCDENFPKKLMIKLSDPEKIRQATSRGLTGVFYARELYFRSNYAISSTEAFGSIWKDLRASIMDNIWQDDEWMTILGERSSRDIYCDVTNSFQIRKKIDFESAIRLIGKLKDEYDRELTTGEESSFYFLNTIQMVNSKEKREELNQALIKKAFDFLTNDEVIGFDFDYDFCHKNYKEFFEANQYIAKKRKTELAHWDNISDAKFVLINLKKEFSLSNIEDFTDDFTGGIKIIAEHEEVGYYNTKGTILEHLHGELTIQNTNSPETYFIIDKKWCLVEDRFLDILSKDFENYIKNKNPFCDEIPLKEWMDGDYESKFNESHLTEDNFLVADRITINGIELFDLLYYNDDKLYIIQVKDGLGASTRDACSQLQNSCKLIEAALIEQKHDKIIEFYNRLKMTKVSYSNSAEYQDQLEKIGSETDFLQKFIDSKERYYVLAFRHGNNMDDILKIKSNIAKFEILGLKDDVKLTDSYFRLYQIKNLEF